MGAYHALETIYEINVISQYKHMYSGVNRMHKHADLNFQTNVIGRAKINDSYEICLALI